MKYLAQEIGKTIRAAIESTPATVRLCCVLIAVGPVAAAALAIATYLNQH